MTKTEFVQQYTDSSAGRVSELAREAGMKITVQAVHDIRYRLRKQRRKHRGVQKRPEVMMADLSGRNVKLRKDLFRLVVLCGCAEVRLLLAELERGMRAVDTELTH